MLCSSSYTAATRRTCRQKKTSTSHDQNKKATIGRCVAHNLVYTDADTNLHASTYHASLHPHSLTAFPVPLGSCTAPRTAWFALRGSTLSTIASSTVSSNLALAPSFTMSRASAMGCIGLRAAASAAWLGALFLFLLFWTLEEAARIACWGEVLGGKRKGKSGNHRSWGGGGEVAVPGIRLPIFSKF